MNKFYLGLACCAAMVMSTAHANDGVEATEVPAVVVTPEEELDYLFEGMGDEGTIPRGELVDPYEDTNRDLFSFNIGLDDYILEPIARGYHDYTPQYTQDRFHDFLQNLREPINFINALLQGEFERSTHIFGRFLTNTTLGIGGLMDVASKSNDDLRYREEDFGQTLAVMGMNEGVYIEVPFLGGMTSRDLVGDIVDIAFDPVTYVTSGAQVALRGAEIVDTRAELLEPIDHFKETSFDLYATLRSARLQNRENLINNRDNAEFGELQ